MSGDEFVAEPYTPTTEHIKYAYVQFTRNAFVAGTGELEAEFDRWFEDVKATAHEEGYDMGYHVGWDERPL